MYEIMKLKLQGTLLVTGLGVPAYSCKKLRRLRIERGRDGQEMKDMEGVGTQED